MELSKLGALTRWFLQENQSREHMTAQQEGASQMDSVGYSVSDGTRQQWKCVLEDVGSSLVLLLLMTCAWHAVSWYDEFAS